MQEAFEILDWGKSASLKSLLGGKEVLLDKAMLLYTHSVQKTLTHFTWYDKAPRDAARSVEMIAALSDVIPIEITREALNTPTRYEMSLLERVCILHDDVARLLVGALMKADPTRFVKMRLPTLCTAVWKWEISKHSKPCRKMAL